MNGAAIPTPDLIVVILLIVLLLWVLIGVVAHDHVAKEQRKLDRILDQLDADRKARP